MSHLLLTEKELAEKYGLRLRTVQRWRFERKGPPYVRLGGLVRYRVAAFEEWLDRCTVATDGGPR